MKIGDRFVIHKVQYPDIDKDKIDEFRILTVTLQRDDVPGMFGKDKYTGFKAEDNKGRVYQHWWTSYPDDAMCPVDEWYCETNGEGFWYGVIHNRLKLDRKPRWLKGEYAKIVRWCNRHKKLYYERCYDCWEEKEHPERKKAPPIRQLAQGW